MESSVRAFVCVMAIFATGCTTQYLGYSTRDGAQERSVKEVVLTDAVVEPSSRSDVETELLAFEIYATGHEVVEIRSKPDAIREHVYVPQQTGDVPMLILGDLLMEPGAFVLEPLSFVLAPMSSTEPFGGPYQDLVQRLEGKFGMGILQQDHWMPVELPEHKPPLWYVRNLARWSGWILPGLVVSLPQTYQLDHQIENLEAEMDWVVSEERVEVKHALKDHLAWVKVGNGPRQEVGTDSNGILLVDVSGVEDLSRIELGVNPVTDGTEQTIVIVERDLPILAQIQQKRETQTAHLATLERLATAVAAIREQSRQVMADGQVYAPDLVVAFKELVSEAETLTKNRQSATRQVAERAQALQAKLPAGLEGLKRGIAAGKNVVAGAQRQLGYAQTAADSIDRTKAVIMAPSELETGDRLVAQARNLLGDGVTLTKAREAHRIAGEALVTFQGVLRKVDAGKTVATMAAPPGAMADLPERRQLALMIGIDAYQQVPKLENAVNDAKSIGSVLRDHYGFEVTEIYNAEATRGNLYRQIRRLVAALEEGNKLLIYFAGHGYEDRLLKEGYWVPVEGRPDDVSTLLSNAEIHKLISSMEKAQHVMLVADSCFAGSFLNTRDLRGMQVRPTDERTVSMFIQKADRRKSRLVFTSGANEPVVDGGRDGHSVFGYYFLRALTDPDYPVFTSAELVMRVQKVVADNAAQTPLSGDLRRAGHEGGQMVFVKQR